jgi:hypothetical protein
MESLDSMRKAEFKNAVEKPRTVNDSRFGLRKLFKTDKEKPSIGIYATPGRGPNGESQN